MKHKTNLGLNTVHSVLKEFEKKEKKEQEHVRRKTELGMLGLLKPEASQQKLETPKSKGSIMTSPKMSHREINPELSRKYAETTKNVRNLMIGFLNRFLDDSVINGTNGEEHGRG